MSIESILRPYTILLNSTCLEIRSKYDKGVIQNWNACRLKVCDKSIIFFSFQLEVESCTLFEPDTIKHLEKI